MKNTGLHVDYPNLDLAKFICALLVVVIHTEPLVNATVLGDFYLNDVIARVAVPLFFAMSGFLFFRSIAYENGRIAQSRTNIKRLLHTTGKNLCLYIAWSAVYLIVVLQESYQSGWWGIAVVKDWVHSFLLIGSYYHLWYILALVAALPVLYFLLAQIPISKIWVTAAILWVLECLTYSYSWIGVDQIPFVAFICDKMPVMFDALFRALPLLTIGAVLSQQRRKPVKMLVCIGAFALCAVEASILHFFTPNESKYSYLFTTPFLTVAIMTVLIYGKQISLPEKSQYHLRNMSLLIYCLHPMICYALSLLGIKQGLFLWGSVTVLSVGMAHLWSELKMRMNKKIIC